MVDIETLKPGMKVKIVDQWVPGCDENNEGFMDKYLGRIVTVSEVLLNDVRIEEDREDPCMRWYWNCFCFDYIVDDMILDLDPSHEVELMSLVEDLWE